MEIQIAQWLLLMFKAVDCKAGSAPLATATIINHTKGLMVRSQFKLFLQHNLPLKELTSSSIKVIFHKYMDTRMKGWKVKNQHRAQKSGGIMHWV
jgi:hypothetical protein